MKRRIWNRDPLYRFHLTAGLCDGILDALVLGAGRLFNAYEPMSFGLALRVATAGALGAVFMGFVAHYVQLRLGLLDAERQLNITSRGRFATTKLGFEALREAAFGAALWGGCAFLGAFYPLSVGAFLPRTGWIAVAAAFVGLIALGFYLGWLVDGNILGWIVFFVVGGACFTLIGLQLKIA